MTQSSEKTLSSDLWGALREMVTRTRQCHALEHATVHLLSQRFPTTPVMGRSTPAGFYIYGDIPTPALASIAGEALARLGAGESHLAVHPRCGTNLAVGALLSGLVSAVFLRRRRPAPWWEELPRLMLAISAVLFLSQPLGYSVQKHVTTSSDVGNVRFATIQRKEIGRQTAHFIQVESL